MIRSVREYERAGVAAFHIEDQVAPKKCGHYEGKAVVSVAEMVGKIKAAVDTRRDPAVIESRLATFNDREVAVNTALWREREGKYLRSADWDDPHVGAMP